MASVTSLGTGSGLDLQGLLTKLMTAESAGPTQRLNKRESALQTELSALGSLKGALSKFQSALTQLKSTTSLAQLTATVGDSSFTATASSSATAGTHSVQVVSLAEAHKIASQGYANTTSSIGTGSLTFQVGTGAAQTVNIAAGSDSLQGIRDAVNAAKIGVTAYIVNGNSGNQLVFVSDKMGATNSIKVTASDADGNNTDMNGLSALAYDPAAVAGAGKNLTQLVAASDAQVKIDTITVTRSSNVITDALQGVTLTLKQQATAATTLTLAQDQAAMTGTVQSFVTAYNDLMGTFKSLGGYNAATKTGGPLQGDPTLLGIGGRVRQIVSAAVTGLTGSYQALINLGVKTQSDGSLALDTTKLNAALSADPGAVARVFAAAGQTSDALISYSKSTSSTQVGTYAFNITQLSTQGSYTGTAAASTTITAGVNDSLTLTVDGIATGAITLGAGTYTGSQLAAELQSRVNGDANLKAAGVSVSVSYNGASGALTLTSDRYGSASNVTNLAGTAFGPVVGAGAAVAGLDVAGTIGGVAATGSGQTLTGTGNAAGLAIKVTGGALGARGSIVFSRGVADQLDSLMTSSLATGSTLSSRTDNANSQLKTVAKDRETLQARLAVTEQRYRAKFIALDTLVSKLNSTSSFLKSKYGV